MKIFINGNEAICHAALHAGCNFFAGYPITPATSILLHMSRELPKVGGIAIQGEDEIASIGFCIGAALAGSRVMTATSGPGISLYSESIGAAIMVEIPIVIVDVQRMGPATGAPTMGAYGDIQFIRWGNSGGYPIIALSPTNIQQCYAFTLRAFDLAERFRCPVFIVIDKETGLTKKSLEISSLERGVIQDHRSPPKKKTATFVPDNLDHPSNFHFCASFGGPDLIRLTTSSHTPSGYLTKDPDSIRIHNEHIISKIQDHIDEITLVHYDPQPKADSIIISYGITAGSATLAVQTLRDQGYAVSHLVIHSLWPVPQMIINEALKDVKYVVIPELNLGLYRREIERFSNEHHQIHGIISLDGSLISPLQIQKKVEGIHRKNDS
jgi:2-oxoglutarate ferredoxin oxidoreductase subunit alpha